MIRTLYICFKTGVGLVVKNLRTMGYSLSKMQHNLMRGIISSVRYEKNDDILCNYRWHDQIVTLYVQNMVLGVIFIIGFNHYVYPPDQHKMPLSRGLCALSNYLTYYHRLHFTIVLFDTGVKSYATRCFNRSFVSFAFT